MNESENLSIKLFKPQTQAQETSTIIGSLSNKPKDIHDVLDGDSHSNWYRILRRPQWSWLGLDAIEIERTLARIAAAKNNRSHETKLDTVIGFRQGNWAYEWSQNAVKAEKAARVYIENQQRQQASHQRLLASQYYSLAAYPYIKGDSLALQTQMLATKNFNAAAKDFPYEVKTIASKVEGKTLEGILYLPHTEEPLPTVIISLGFDWLQTDCWRLFERYFLPAGIAMLTLDMPSLGRSDYWYLTEDSSKLHQVMLHELKSVPWVDHTRVGCLGIRFAGNAAVRLAFLEPNRLKSCVSIGGILHSSLCDSKKLGKLTAMQLDSIASRIGKNVSSSLLTHLQALSLKNQGLLGGRKTPVPLLALSLEGDPFGTEFDSQLAARYSKEGEAKILKSSLLHDGYHRILLEAMKWFRHTL